MTVRLAWIGLEVWRRHAKGEGAALPIGDFTAPRIALVRHRRFERARLTASALHRLSGQTPWKLAQFARAPMDFDGAEVDLQLLHQAARQQQTAESDDRQT